MLDLDFTKPAPSGNSGFHKVTTIDIGNTSILEAITIGLFGQQGLPLTVYGNYGLAVQGGQQAALYSEFLEAAFNVIARETGQSTMSVKLTFDTDAGEQLGVERIWHFSESGEHKVDLEEISIRNGLGDEIVGTEYSGIRKEQIQEFIVKNLPPVDLATFFMFDGRWALRVTDQDLAKRIRSAIEVIQENGGPIQPDTREELADSMTRAFRSLATEGTVDRIEIDTDCAVQPLSRDGQSLGTMDISSGEQYKIALSLIVAMAKVSKRRFPIILDTTQSPLDDPSQERRLQYLAAIDSQVVLLARPEILH